VKRSRTVGRRTRTLVWSERAKRDLVEIGDFIARDDRNAAARWIARLMTTAARTAVTPGAGRRVPELARDEVRELLLRTYRIVYRVSRTKIEVLTVFEGHRLFPPDVDT